MSGLLPLSGMVEMLFPVALAMVNLIYIIFYRDARGFSQVGKFFCRREGAPL